MGLGTYILTVELLIWEVPKREGLTLNLVWPKTRWSHFHYNNKLTKNPSYHIEMQAWRIHWKMTNTLVHKAKYARRKKGNCWKEKKNNLVSHAWDIKETNENLWDDNSTWDVAYQRIQNHVTKEENSIDRVHANNQLQLKIQIEVIIKFM